jgi:hypothetical protein
LCSRNGGSYAVMATTVASAQCWRIAERQDSEEMITHLVQFKSESVCDL